MQGYVIVMADEPAAKPTHYFDGSVMQEDIDLSSVYQNRSEAKYASSNLVGIYSDKEVEVREVVTSITLA